MISRPVTITTPNEPTLPVKQTLFRIALTVAMIGSVIVSAILFLQGGLALGHLGYFIDIGHHPLHITSIFLIIFGFFSILTFIILTIGLIKMNRNFTIIATVLLIICTLGLNALSIWSFITLSSGKLPQSINNILLHELDQTKYNFTNTNNNIVQNTDKMAKLEKQHQCCGLANGTVEYASRQYSTYGSSQSNTGPSKGRISNSQRNPSTPILLPISCCNENYFSSENNLCIDMFENNTNIHDRYNKGGCYDIIIRDKKQRIRQQGFTTIIATCLAVISCISLAAVIKLLNQSYQITPIPITT